MSFINNGIPHYEGISNEKCVINTYNETEFFGVPVYHQGGTQTKKDATIGGNLLSLPGITIKRKKRLTVGSFDYLNTSILPAHTKEALAPFLAEVRVFRESMSITERSNKSFLKSIRDQLNSLLRKQLDQLTPEDINSVLEKALISGHSTIQYLSISDVHAEKLHTIPIENIPSIVAIKAGLQPKLIGHAAQSRKLVFINTNGSELNTDLKLRLTTNNGIKALLGISDSNSTSVIVLKLMQFKAQSLIKCTNIPTLKLSIK